MSRIKRLYDSLCESGELLEMFPHLSGDYQKDKKRFEKEQKELEDSITGFDVNLDLDETEEDYYG